MDGAHERRGTRLLARGAQRVRDHRRRWPVAALPCARPPEVTARDSRPGRSWQARNGEFVRGEGVGGRHWCQTNTSGLFESCGARSGLRQRPWRSQRERRGSHLSCMNGFLDRQRAPRRPVVPRWRTRQHGLRRPRSSTARSSGPTRPVSPRTSSWVRRISTTPERSMTGIGVLPTWFLVRAWTRVP